VTAFAAGGLAAYPMFLYARSTTVSTRRLMVVDGRPGRRDSRSWRFVRRPLGLSGENRRRSIESMSRRTLLAATVPPRRPPSLSSPPLSSLSLSLFRARAPRLPRVLTISLSRLGRGREDREREKEREDSVRARYASRASSCGSLTGTWWNYRRRSSPSERRNPRRRSARADLSVGDLSGLSSSPS